MRLASLAFWGAAATSSASSGTLTASVGVDTFCTVSTSALQFGQYDPIVANKTAAATGTAAVTVTCVKGTAPTIALALGSNPAGSTRQMKHETSGALLAYELYQPPGTGSNVSCVFPATTPVWGSSGSNLFSPGAAPSKASRVFNVCGTVPGGQNVEVGKYSDTVFVTVNF